MSMILVPWSFETWLEKILSTFTEAEKEQFKKTVHLLEQEVFMPIFEAKNKEVAIKRNLNKFINYYLVLLSPIVHKIKSEEPIQELFSHLYHEYRKLVKEKVKNPVIRAEILKVLDICEEHDDYASKVFLEPWKNLEFLESIDIQDYLNVAYKMTLSLTVLWLALKEGKPFSEWSQIVKKYAEELEPFIATFQVYIEPELAFLKMKATKQEIEEAKEL